MSEPTYGYSTTVAMAANDALLTTLSVGSTHPTPTLTLYDASDEALVVVEILVGSSVIDVDGTLTLAVSAPDPTLSVAGTASYAVIADRDGDAHVRMPCVEGLTEVPGACAIDSLTIVTGRTIQVMPITIAPPPGISA